MKFFTASQHIGIIDAITCLQSLGHTVVNRSYSHHSFVHGWERVELDFDTCRLYDPNYCNKWYDCVPGMVGCDAWIAYYPPTLALAMAESDLRGVMIAPVRMWLDCDGANIPEMIDRFQQYVDDGVIILAADSRYDAACVEHHLKRTCRYLKPICSYFNAPGPIGNVWAVESRIQMPEHELLEPMTSREPSDWKYAGFVHIPYQASTVGAHERLLAGYPYLIPHIDTLRALWGSKKNKWLEVDFGAGGFNGIDHLELADWYNGEYPNIRYWKNFKELNDLLREPYEPIKPVRPDLSQWEQLIKDLS